MTRWICLLIVGCAAPSSLPTPEPASPITPPVMASESVAFPAAKGAQALGWSTSGRALLATWFEPKDNSHRLQTSTRVDGRWSTPVTVVSDQDFFVNWADTPQIARGGDRALYISHAKKSAQSTYAYDVVLARSTDDGATWTTLGPPHLDGTPTEHGFVSLVPTKTGVQAIWLDGRTTGDKGPMQLRTAAIGGTIAPDSLLDDRVCDCCGTSAVSLPNDDVFVAYRDRTDDDIRDVHGLRISAPEQTVAAGQTDWRITGCPVNGPQVVSSGASVQVASYRGEPNTVVLRRSADGGQTFAPPIVIAQGKQVQGRVGLLAHDDRAVVSWMASPTPDDAVLRVARVDAAGNVQVHDIVPLDPSRGSGIPRIARTGQALMLAWTTEAGITAVSVPGFFGQE